MENAAHCLFAGDSPGAMFVAELSCLKTSRPSLGFLVGVRKHLTIWWECEVTTPRRWNGWLDEIPQCLSGMSQMTIWTLPKIRAMASTSKVQQEKSQWHRIYRIFWPRPPPAASSRGPRDLFTHGASPQDRDIPRSQQLGLFWLSKMVGIWDIPTWYIACLCFCVVGNLECGTVFISFCGLLVMKQIWGS